VNLIKTKKRNFHNVCVLNVQDTVVALWSVFNIDAVAVWSSTKDARE
jgi:hypothetical protein